MSSYMSVQGIVLKRTDFGEYDRILTLLTFQLGIVNAIAKGVKKLGSKLAPAVELYAISDLLLARGKSLFIVTQGKRLNNLELMYSNVFAQAAAAVASEVVLGYIEHNVVAERAYKELEHLIRSFERKEVDVLWELALFLARFTLINGIGLRPDVCTQCGKSITYDEQSFYLPECGYFVCSRCSSHASNKISVSKDIVDCIASIYNLAEGGHFSFLCERKSLLALYPILIMHIEHHVGGRLHSIRPFKQLFGI